LAGPVDVGVVATPLGRLRVRCDDGYVVVRVGGGARDVEEDDGAGHGLGRGGEADGEVGDGQGRGAERLVGVAVQVADLVGARHVGGPQLERAAQDSFLVTVPSVVGRAGRDDGYEVVEVIGPLPRDWQETPSHRFGGGVQR